MRSSPPGPSPPINTAVAQVLRIPYYVTRWQCWEDVLDEYVSIEAARDHYGVVLTGSVEAYDLAN